MLPFAPVRAVSICTASYGVGLDFTIFTAFSAPFSSFPDFYYTALKAFVNAFAKINGKKDNGEENFGKTEQCKNKQDNRE